MISLLSIKGSAHCSAGIDPEALSNRIAELLLSAGARVAVSKEHQIKFTSSWFYGGWSYLPAGICGRFWIERDSAFGNVLMYSANTKRLLWYELPAIVITFSAPYWLNMPSQFLPLVAVWFIVCDRLTKFIANSKLRRIAEMGAWGEEGNSGQSKGTWQI